MSNHSGAGGPACDPHTPHPLAAASAAEPQRLETALRGLPAANSDSWLAGRVVAELAARQRAAEWLRTERGRTLSGWLSILPLSTGSFSRFWRDLRRAFVG